MYICMKGVSMELRKKILDLNDMEMLLHSSQYVNNNTFVKRIAKL